MQSDLEIRLNDLNKTDYSMHLRHSLNNQKPRNIFLSFLYKIHTSNKINNIINLPFQQIWNQYWLFDVDKKPTFKNSKRLCFIIYARYFDALNDTRRKLLIDHLRINYLFCKIVLYLGDLLTTHCFDITIYRQNFDAIFTFDKNDALYNNFIYYDDEPFSFYEIKRNQLLPESDIVFIGRAKNRLKEIIKIFELLQENNITCDFNIIDVPLSQQKYVDKIKYCENMPYSKLLEHVVSSKCILEVLQHGGSSPTTRVAEAICYGKKLLSNCHEIKTKPYYNPKFISLFSNPEDIDIEFLKRDIGNINYNYIQNFSPLRFIEFVDKQLTKNYIKNSK